MTTSLNRSLHSKWPINAREANQRNFLAKRAERESQLSNDWHASQAFLYPNRYKPNRSEMARALLSCVDELKALTKFMIRFGYADSLSPAELRQHVEACEAALLATMPKILLDTPPSKWFDVIRELEELPEPEVGDWDNPEHRPERLPLRNPGRVLTVMREICDNQTVEQVSAGTGLSVDTLRGFESGYVTPTLGDIERLCAHFDSDVMMMRETFGLGENKVEGEGFRDGGPAPSEFVRGPYRKMVESSGLANNSAPVPPLKSPTPEPQESVLQQLWRWLGLV